MRWNDACAASAKTHCPREEAAAAAFAAIWPRRTAGATLLELLLLIALVAALSLMVSPFLSDSVSRRSLDLFAAQASDALREAQFSAVNGKGSARFGVHFQADRFVFFQGAVYNPADSENITHLLDNGVTIASITLSGGGADVHFASHRGIPTESGTVVLTGPDGATKTVVIGAAGMIDIN